MQSRIAEVEGIETELEKKKVKSQDEFERMRKNFSKIVFDGVGNYIYTRPDEQDAEQKCTVKEAISNVRMTSKSLKKKLLAKTQNFKPKKIIDNLVRSAQEIAQMNPRRRAILEAKSKSEVTKAKHTHSPPPQQRPP